MPEIPLPKTPDEARLLTNSFWENPRKWIPLIWDRMPATDGVTSKLELWERQAELVDAIRDHRRVVCRSGHGVGKTMVNALVGILWMISHPNATCVTTGSSYRVLDEILWPQVRELLGQSTTALGAKSLQKKWLPGGDDYPKWQMVAVSATDKNNFAGFHNPHGVLVIIEEADGVNAEIFESAVSCAQGEKDRVLAVGNPHTPNGAFAKKFKSPKWHKMKISCMEHPNVVEGREVIPGMVSRQWVEMMKSELGETSAAYMTRVLGEFPAEDQFTLVPLHWWEAALNRDAPEEPSDRSTTLAVDVARSDEGDREVFCATSEFRLEHFEDHRGMSVTATANRTVTLCRELMEAGTPVRRVVIDDTGIGGGVTDILLNERWEELAALGVEGIVPFNGASSPVDSRRYVNARTEAHWELRKKLDPENSKFSVIGASDSFLELTSIRTKPHPSGRIAIMPKNEMIKLGYLTRSPDFSDALMMTCTPLPSVTGSASSETFSLAGIGFR